MVGGGYECKGGDGVGDGVGVLEDYGEMREGKF